MALMCQISDKSLHVMGVLAQKASGGSKVHQRPSLFDRCNINHTAIVYDCGGSLAVGQFHCLEYGMGFVYFGKRRRKRRIGRLNLFWMDRPLAFATQNTCAACGGLKALQVGKIRLEVMGETRPCELMDKMYAGLREVMKDRWGGGCWAQVLDDGEIAVGDDVSFAVSS